jgi:hypothetical protein
MLFSISYMVTYLVTLIFVFLGVYVGALLAFIAPEELKPGKAYFKALANTILVFLLLILLYSYGANLYVLIFLGVAASVFLYFTSETTPVNQIAYFLLGIAFYFSTGTTDLFIISSTLIFIYGMPLGSLYVARNPRRSKSMLLTDILLNFGFFIIIALMANLVALYIRNW